MMKVLQCLFAVSLVVCGAAGAGTFVARVKRANATMLRRIIETPCAACGKDDGLVDMWDPDAMRAEDVPGWFDGAVDVRGGEELRRVLEGVEFEYMHRDFEAAVVAEQKRVRENSTRWTHLGAAEDPWFADYQTYASMLTKLEALAGTYSGASLFTLGTTYEGNEIRGIRFGSSTEKHAVWIQCGIHAREWIAPATCMYVAQTLLQQQAHGDREVQALLSKVVVYLVPVLNRDGYEYSWSTNRMWRKNRQPNQGSIFVGTDLNRNWDASWGGCGASTSPSSDTYRGPSVFSAPESQAVRSFFASLKAEGYHILGGHDVHSYGNLLLRPYGWTNQNAPNNAIEEQRGADMVSAIRAQSGQRYTNQRSYDLYCCSGLACDWLAQETTEGSGFTFELRGTPGGFVLPPDQIVPTGQEIYAAMLVWLRSVTYSKQ